MRVMLHTVPPWAPSGYGVQAALLARGLRDAGHEVILSVYGGFIREEPWEGMRLLACGGTSKGVGRIAHNYRRAKADVMITVCDLWPLDAREFEGLHVVSWLPVDTSDRLGMPDVLQLRAASELCASFQPVAMSDHGRRLLEGNTRNFVKFSDVPVIPHMVAPEYRPGNRSAWREENNIPAGVFLFSTVGVNGDYPCRKGFPELLCALQLVAERHADVRLYMHTQASPGVEGVDLLEIAKSLGLRNRVGFPDQEMRLADEHTAGYMAGMYRGSDALVMASLGEGFSVPCIEAAACGTPLIAAHGSALAERDAAWWCATQPSWCKLHQAWWHVPLIASLADAMEHAYLEARDPQIRRAAKLSAARYLPQVVIPQWVELLQRV